MNKTNLPRIFVPLNNALVIKLSCYLSNKDINMVIFMMKPILLPTSQANVLLTRAINNHADIPPSDRIGFHFSV